MLGAPLILYILFGKHNLNGRLFLLQHMFWKTMGRVGLYYNPYLTSLYPPIFYTFEQTIRFLVIISGFGIGLANAIDENSKKFFEELCKLETEFGKAFRKE